MREQREKSGQQVCSQIGRLYSRDSLLTPTSPRCATQRAENPAMSQAKGEAGEVQRRSAAIWRPQGIIAFEIKTETCCDTIPLRIGWSKSPSVTLRGTLWRTTKSSDGLRSLVPTVHEFVYKFTDLAWTLGPSPQFFCGPSGDSHGDRNAIRARFSPRPVSFAAALLGRVWHAQKLA